MKENITALDEINKGTCMGMDAIKFILDKTEDKKFKKVLKDFYKEYEKINKKIEKIYPKYNDGNPHETNIINKAMTWYGIEVKTLKDNSNSKIAELLLQGTNMGIIEGRKILNKKEIDKKINELIEKYVTMQEDNVEILKQYL